MKIALVTPWDNAWVPMYRDACERRGHRFILSRIAPEGADVVLHGWATGKAIKGSVNIMFLRRYELFSGDVARVKWEDFDAAICVNTWMAARLEEACEGQGADTHIEVIYNAADEGRWTFRKRRTGMRIGMACHVHPKKNLPLAAQMLAMLPPGYELHIAGEVQDSCTAEYLNHFAKASRRRIYLYGHVDAEHMDSWWEDKNICLSTSISEGNPNNVIEAMAKGIKPVVHGWPGAVEQFGHLVFNDVRDGLEMIQADAYSSDMYLGMVRERFSVANIERVLDLCELYSQPKEVVCVS